AMRTPDAIAVVCGPSALTYGELNARANQVARALRRKGVGPEVPVGLCVERSTEIMVGLLGILKAGGAYVPIDPAYPADRIAFVLEDSRATLLLTQERLRGSLPNTRLQTLCVDRTDWFEEESRGNLQGSCEPENLAYIIYTSGSTGQPKGVPVTHRNLAHSTTARFRHYAGAVGNYLLLSSFGFDSSVAGIFWTLCQGGTLTLP